MAANKTGALVMRIVSASVAVSNRASQIIRDVMKKGDLGIVEKMGKNDLQTEADRSAQRCIVASLHKQFPKVSIFGEEQLSPSEKIPNDFYEMGFSEEVLSHKCPDYLKDVKDEDIVIWVDPLDGTAEYTQGLLDHVTVLIGIAVKGNAIGGVINQPYYNYKETDKPLGRCIWGICGVGSFGFTRQKLPEGLVITTTRSHSTRMVTECIDSFNPTEVIRVGGAGHKVLLLIEGYAHAYIFATKGCKKWDTCAPEAILHTLGGSLTDMFGVQMSYDKDVKRLNAGGVLATWSDHNRFVNGVDEEILNSLEKSDAAPSFEGAPKFMGGNDGKNNDSCQDQVELPPPAPPSPESLSSIDSRNSAGDIINKESTETKL